MKNITTQVLEKLNIKVPIIQAPMAGATTSRLIAAVSNAGALGSLGAGYLDSAELRENILEIKSLTNKPFAVNLFVSRVIDQSEEKIKKMNAVLIPYRNKFGISQEEHFPEKLDILDEQTDVLIAEKVPIVSFTFGVLPSKIIQKLKKNNVILIGTATTVNEENTLGKKRL